MLESFMWLNKSVSKRSFVLLCIASISCGACSSESGPLPQPSGSSVSAISAVVHSADASSLLNPSSGASLSSTEASVVDTSSSVQADSSYGGSSSEAGGIFSVGTSSSQGSQVAISSLSLSANNSSLAYSSVESYSSERSSSSISSSFSSAQFKSAKLEKISFIDLAVSMKDAEFSICDDLNQLLSVPENLEGLSASELEIVDSIRDQAEINEWLLTRDFYVDSQDTILYFRPFGARLIKYTFESEGQTYDATCKLAYHYSPIVNNFALTFPKELSFWQSAGARQNQAWLDMFGSEMGIALGEDGLGFGKHIKGGIYYESRFDIIREFPIIFLLSMEYDDSLLDHFDDILIPGLSTSVVNYCLKANILFSNTSDFKESSSRFELGFGRCAEEDLFSEVSKIDVGVLTSSTDVKASMMLRDVESIFKHMDAVDKDGDLLCMLSAVDLDVDAIRENVRCEENARNNIYETLTPFYTSEKDLFLKITFDGLLEQTYRFDRLTAEVQLNNERWLLD